MTRGRMWLGRIYLVLGLLFVLGIAGNDERLAHNLFRAQIMPFWQIGLWIVAGLLLLGAAKYYLQRNE